MASFTGLDSAKGLSDFNKYLADHSYVEGFTPSAADAELFKQVGSAPDPAKFQHAARWYNHIESFSHEERASWGSSSPANTAAEVPHSSEAKQEKAKEDDFDLFGDDENDEHEQEIERRAQEQLARAAAKKKAEGKHVVLKSAVVIDVKPWEDTTDMVEMERKIREIQMEGLEWKASKLVAIGYGIKKLSISCHVIDEVVSIDDIQEKIQEFEELVQSTEVQSFTKL